MTLSQTNDICDMRLVFRYWDIDHFENAIDNFWESNRIIESSSTYSDDHIAEINFVLKEWNAKFHYFPGVFNGDEFIQSDGFYEFDCDDDLILFLLRWTG